MSKIGRNDICPCGSGKKYKRCCIEADSNPAQAAATQDCLGPNLDAKINAAVDHYRNHNFPAAIAICLEIEEIDSELPFTQIVRGAIFAMRRQWDAALQCFQKARLLSPNDAEIHNNIGVVMGEIGGYEGAVDSLRRALELRHDYYDAHSNLLLCLSHMESLAEKFVFEEHCAFGRNFASWAEKYPAHANSAQPERRLRLGFVSADLRAHPVATLVEALWETLDRSRFDIMVYSNSTIEDDVSLRLKKLATSWNTVSGTQDDDLATLIMSDQIDILFDLSGHTTGNRLPVFARKPAPIQVSWLGYPGTTGLSAIDYYLADPHLAPVGIDRFFREKIVRVPAVCCFMPPPCAPLPNTLPALRKPAFMFASLNRNSKIGDRVIKLWSRVLTEVPHAKMLLGAIDDEKSSARLLKEFAQYGISQERLVLYPRLEAAAYLKLHHDIDLILDTFPYSGGTTSANALWMGVPVLTLAGTTMASRQSACLLHPVDLSEFVTESEDQFVAEAIGWTKKLPELNRIRTALRERIESLPSMDAKSVTYGFEKAMRLIWQRWCEKLPPESIHVTRQDVAPLEQVDLCL